MKLNIVSMITTVLLSVSALGSAQAQQLRGTGGCLTVNNTETTESNIQHHWDGENGTLTIRQFHAEEDSEELHAARKLQLPETTPGGFSTVGNRNSGRLCGFLDGLA